MNIEVEIKYNVVAYQTSSIKPATVFFTSTLESMENRIMSSMNSSSTFIAGAHCRTFSWIITISSTFCWGVAVENSFNFSTI